MFGRVVIMVLIGCLVFLITSSVEAQSQASAVDWHAKYVKQKKKSLGQYHRIQVLNKRVKALRGSASPLQASIVKWVLLAECESGNSWTINSGNGFFGGVQFNGGTWRSYGGQLFAPTANGASPVAQVAIAEKVLARQGRGAWPHCSEIGAW